MKRLTKTLKALLPIIAVYMSFLITNNAAAISIIDDDQLIVSCDTTCVVNRIVDPDNHNSGTITSGASVDDYGNYVFLADVTYGYRNRTSVNKTVGTYALGERQYSDTSCPSGAACSKYVIKGKGSDGVTRILTESEIRIDMINPSPDGFSYTAYASSACSEEVPGCNDSSGRNFNFSPSLRIVVYDGAQYLLNQNLIITKYICSTFNGVACSESGAWSFIFKLDSTSIITDPCADNPCCLPGEGDISSLPAECFETSEIPSPQGDGQLSSSTQITSSFEWNGNWQNNDIRIHYPIREGNISRVSTPAAANANPGYVKFKHEVAANNLQQTIAGHDHIRNYGCWKGPSWNRYWGVCQEILPHAEQTLVPTTTWNTNLNPSNNLSGVRVPMSGQNSFTQANRIESNISTNQRVPALYSGEDSRNIVQRDQINAGLWCQNIQASAIETVYGTTVYGHQNSVAFNKDASSRERCYSVPLLFNLKPHIEIPTINNDATIEPGENIRADVGVYAAYNRTFDSCNIGVTVSQWYTIKKPDGITQTISLSNYNWSQCQSDDAGTTYMEISGGVTVTLPIGTEICFYKRVSSYTNDPYIYRLNETPWLYIGDNEPNGRTVSNCDNPSSTVTVTKRATIQIHGADSWSGTDSSNGGFLAKNPSNNLNIEIKSGSWSQYGLFTTGCIDQTFGSAGWLHQTAGNNQESHTRLKFANTLSNTSCSSGQLGQFTTDHRITNMRSYYSAMIGNIINENSSIDIATLPLNTPREITHYVYTGKINLSLDNPELTFSGRQILIFDGDVTITKDIIYAGNFTSIYSVPTLTIIAKNIYIESSVRQIDAILVADESLSTCADATDSIDYRYDGTCAASDTENIGLTINGAIIANLTRFQRTNGARNVNDPTPAELIRYSPTVYLSNYAYQRTQQKDLKTILRREVAPRW